MQIETQGAGPWPVVNVECTVVTLAVGEDALTFDCTALQGDSAVTVDVVRDEGGKLAVGVANGTVYVANLILPPARYVDTVPPPLPMPLSEDEDGETPGMFSMMNSGGTREVVPLDEEGMAAVRLILWSVPETVNIME